MSGSEKVEISYESVAVSTRLRLARNIADYPFPHRIGTPETAREIVHIVSLPFVGVEDFTLYRMNLISDDLAALLKERNLISQDLIDRRRISAALISKDESISVMINEEDHLREQYFMQGFDLRRAYERISGIDEIISESVDFAFDKELGYLTSCPTNLGTGLRASVMLFLPALTRRGRMNAIVHEFKQLGLAVRGAFGEGSGAEGYLYQVSNERTLGPSEERILNSVGEAVNKVAVEELYEREILAEKGGLPLADGILRAYGVLTNCLKIGAEEFARLMAEIKLGVALGILEGDMGALDALIVDLRPANIDRLNGAPLSPEDREVYRAEYGGKALRGMELLTENQRKNLTPRR